MLRLRCPTGCSGVLPRPYPRRTEPVRCPNCRAWLAAPAFVEDGGLATALVLAAPGQPLAAPPRPGRRRPIAIVAVLVLIVIVAVALAAFGGWRPDSAG